MARLFRIITQFQQQKEAIMGGINSGRKRSVHRGAVEQFPVIDMRVLKRAGLLKPGECTYDMLRWQNQDLTLLEERIFIDLSDPDDASIRIAGDVAAQRAAIECVPCPYGGYRCYFLCPLIGIRCEQLFLVDGIFASRKAHKLTYASQSEDDLSRSRRKVRKLYRQVEGDNRYARPRGRKRYSKVQALKQAKREARELYHEKLSAMVGDTR
ncbi:hypothetical protein [Alterisphingorhabdus coralli]|uniref:Uncharacterized protein n=1 Tax=Alterisphingorhabdus coralli TaxID=3071408 RepID=A0AA97I0X3_9SPHN|nr:hypothetical protein [Parasphingorhabdus sp. SCSIO 66989]WOE74655.1 hypothetical protein RB602_12485 [Parasphingorhabdus sp. SCSIO 66989]